MGVGSTLESCVRILGRRVGPSCLAGDREGVVARVATELGEECTDHVDDPDALRL